MDARRLFEKQHPKVGARPGTLVIPPGSPPPRVRVMRYGADSFEEIDLVSVEELVPLLQSGDRLWVDVQGWGDEAILWRLAELLHIHPLALEDAVNAPQRPKAEPHSEHLLVIARTPVADDDGGLGLPQVCVFIGLNHVITFQERYLGVLDPVRERARNPASRIRASRPDYLGYALTDALVDRFYPVVEELGKSLDELEERITQEPTPDNLSEIQRLRRTIVALRRVAWAQREMVRDLLRDDIKFVSDEVRIFLRDTHDHMAQISDVIDSSRDIAVSLMDIYLSVMGQRTNDVMKVLTIMSSVFIPLTFMAGIYGMNFEHMPELHTRWAYPGLLTAMGVVAVGLLLYFRHLGWIGTSSTRRKDRPPHTRPPHWR